MGKTREQSQSIDPKLTEFEHAQLERAKEAMMIPFMPNRGLRLAAFTPRQEHAFGMGDQAASAFGFGAPNNIPFMPQPENVGGVRGYSTGGLYDQTVNQSVTPAMQEYISNFFVDPATGLPFGGGQPQVNAPAQPQQQTNPINPYWNSREGGFGLGDMF